MRQGLRRGCVRQRLPLVLFALAAAVVAAPVRAAEPEWVTQMPSAREVIAKVKGHDWLDTQARRYATFERLVAITSELEGPREFNPTPAERQVAFQYRQNVGKLAGQAQSLPPPRRARWFKRARAYEANARFNSQLIATFLSPTVRAAYIDAHAVNVRAEARHRAAEKAAEKRVRQQEQNRIQQEHGGHPGIPLRTKIFFGIVLVLVGVAGGGAGRWVYVRW
jgi:hypothetical protein